MGFSRAGPRGFLILPGAGFLILYLFWPNPFDSQVEGSLFLLSLKAELKVDTEFGIYDEAQSGVLMFHFKLSKLFGACLQ